MLSYNTLIAIHLIHVLHRSEGRRLAISEIKYEGRFYDPGNAAGRVMRLLRKEGWVECDYRNRYRLAVDPDQKSLLDLVIDMDEEIRLGGNAQAGYWSMAACGELLPVSDLSELLRKEFAVRLENINLGTLIAKPTSGNTLQTYEPAENRERAAGW